MRTMDRRQFLKTTLAGASGLLLAGRRLDAAPASPGPFDLVPLGKTGIKVSRIAQGTGMSGGMRASNHTRMGLEAFTALVRGGFERGIRFFDVADLYGTHPFLAQALKGIPRDQYVINTKIWVLPKGIPEEERPDANIVVDRFRKELGTDYIDSIMFHCMSTETWTDEQKRQMDILATLKAKGVIRAHGISSHGLPALQAAAVCPWTDLVLARINAFGDKMDAPLAEVVPVLRKIHAAGKGVLSMKVLAAGGYRKDPQKRAESARFVATLGCVDAMPVGFEKVEEIDEFAANVAAALKQKAAAA